MFFTRRFRRRLGQALSALGLALLSVAVISEFVGAEWWSAVDLAKLRQRFVIVINGHITIGTRGTAGFFNRAIPAAGVRTMSPRSFDSEPLAIRLVPDVKREFQIHRVSIPLYTPGLVIAAYGGYFLVTGPIRRRNRCAECGYDLTGVAAAICPECSQSRPGHSLRSSRA